MHSFIDVLCFGCCNVPNDPVLQGKKRRKQLFCRVNSNPQGKGVDTLYDLFKKKERTHHQFFVAGLFMGKVSKSVEKCRNVIFGISAWIFF